MWPSNRGTGADTPHDCQPGYAARANTRPRSGHSRKFVLSRPKLLPYSIPFTRTRSNIAKYKDAQVQLEVDHWFRTLPMAFQKYLLPLQSAYQKWYNENVRDLPQNYAHCIVCQTKTANLQRHFMQHHARWRTIWFCPVPGCPVSTPNKEGLVKHLQSKLHTKGVDVFRARAG